MLPHTAGGVQRARRLRRDMTDAERRLWRALREAQPRCKWRRQVPAGGYIADFLSFPCRLVLEVDGAQHQDRTDYDDERTRYLESLGFRVLRFWNSDVLKNLDGVLSAIAEAVALTPTPLPAGRGASVAPIPAESPLPDGRGLGEGEGEGL